jgi:hypothetical protein
MSNSMFAHVIGYLRCPPNCSEILAAANGSLRCAHGHNYDIAR